MELIDLENAKKWAKMYIDVNKKRIEPVPLEERFPDRDPEVLKLLHKCLTINPGKRIGVDDALKVLFIVPSLQSYLNPSSEYRRYALTP